MPVKTPVSILALASLAVSSLATTEIERLEAVQEIPYDRHDLLKAMSLFTFAIMGDNKGAGLENRHFSNCVNQINDLDAKFIVGMGDDLSNSSYMGFLNFTATNEFWNTNFWPNVADGENRHYSGSQATWGGGRPIYDHFSLTNRPGVTVLPFGEEKPGENSVSYYVPLVVTNADTNANVAIHLVQMTFSDQPTDTSQSFRDETREFLTNTLTSIDKSGGRDITLAVAHSLSGYWINVLNSTRKNIVLSECDIALAATTHYYGRPANHGTNATLELNTGHCGAYNSSESTSGFLAGYVIDDPLCLLLMYTRTTENTMSIQPYTTDFNGQIGTYAKFIESGNIYEVEFGQDYSPPSQPTNLRVVAVGETHVELAWDAASDPDTGITNYIVYRDSSNVGTSTSTNFTDTGLNSSTTYGYEVSAVNGGSTEGARSDPVNGTTSAKADADGDGMPDAWEITHFGGTNEPNGAATNDWDSDGLINLHEHWAGTIPTNPASVFGIVGIGSSGGTSTLHWLSVTNRLYSVFRSTNLSLSWSGLPATSDIPGSLSGTSVWTDTDNSGPLFYRVETELP